MTMPIGIVGSNNLALLDWGSRCLAKGKENAWIQAFVLLPSLLWNALSFNQSTAKPSLPIITFDIVAFTFKAFVRQPLSKQLYALGVSRSSLTGVFKNPGYCQFKCLDRAFLVYFYNYFGLQPTHYGAMGVLLNTERSYITRLRCSACQSQIPTGGQCSHLIGLFTQV